MSNYPEVVARIANDYLDRVKSQLRLVPAPQQKEFLAEIESHIYESYRHGEEPDDIARILAVLRNLGEPAEVVSDRLPGTMARSGARRNLPLYIIGAIFMALFGIPLGFGGFGVLVGLMGALAGVVIAFFAVTGSVILVGALFTLIGLIRILWPQLFDRLVVLGVINLNGPPADFLDHFTRSEQNLMILLAGALILGLGYGMLRAGIYLLRGLRFLFNLLFDRFRRFAKAVRARLRAPNAGVPHAPRPDFADRPTPVV